MANSHADSQAIPDACPTPARTSVHVRVLFLSRYSASSRTWLLQLATLGQSFTDIHRVALGGPIRFLLTNYEC